MGTSHARVYSELETVELVGIADEDRTRAHELAERFHTADYGDYQRMISRERVDAVSVVVPTTLHAAVACGCMQSGVHALVEKPIASTPLEVRRMMRVAADAKVKLSVGHIERFNPAIRELKARLCLGELGEVFQIHARRLGPFPDRIRDVGVVVDLATHDIDVMHFLLNATPTRVYAETERQIHTEHEDMLSGLMKFPDGIVGVLETNWLTPTKVRELRITGERGVLVARYLEQDLYFYGNPTRSQGTLDDPPPLLDGNAVKLEVEHAESLGLELRSFVDCIVSDRQPTVTAEDGLSALVVAQALVQSGVEGRVIDLRPALVA